MATQGLNIEEQKAVDAFRQNVVEPSMSKLVILDFWAEWCGPCKQLGPILEKVAADYADRGVHLVKIDVDKEGFIASQFQVRSIPTVYAMFQGQPVADLTQARTEQQLSSILDELLEKLPISDSAATDDSSGETVEALLGQAEVLLGNDRAEEAYLVFSRIYETAPDNEEAAGGLVRSLAALDRTDEAATLMDSFPDTVIGHAAIERARAALALASEKRDDGELAQLREEAAAHPDDNQKQFDLAVALAADDQRDEAAELLLGILSRDRDWSDGAARTRLLQMFETIGLEDPWVAATRRKLSAILFG